MEGQAVTHVLIADAVPVFRAGVRSVLSREPDLAVSEAATLAGLLQAAQRGAPDVVLVDLGLPPSGGIAAIQELVERSPAPTALWALDADADAVIDAVRVGASGCVTKDVATDGLVRAVRALARGEAVVPRPLQAVVLDALRRFDERERARARAARLTFRERQVLALVAQGARNRQIAEELEISEFTVKRHVQRILQKLEVASRGAAATFYEPIGTGVPALAGTGAP